MSLEIEKAAAGLRVRISDVAGREHALLERIRSCRQSAWACPSGECMSIASMDEQPGEGSIVLTLTPRPGDELSPAGIEQCLRYMLQEFIK